MTDGPLIVQSDKTLQVKIPAGVDNGDRIRLQGEGELQLATQAGARWQATGALRWRQLNPAALHTALPSQRLNIDAQADSDTRQAATLRLTAQPSAGGAAGRRTEPPASVPSASKPSPAAARMI